MRRGSLFIILFVLIAAMIIGATTLLRSQPALEITVAADPLAEAWLREAALAFNQSGATVGVGRRVRVNISVRSDTAVLQQTWTPNSHPVGWVPAWSSVANISRGSSVSAQVAALSLARTPLVLMSFDSRVAEIPVLSWAGLQTAASTSVINLAFSLPTNSVQGLGAVISAIADFHQTSILSDAQLSNTAMRAWLAPLVESVPNFNTVGSNVAQYVAGPQGGTVDAAIASESQWLLSLSTLSLKGVPRFAYPAFPVVFDFPFLILRSTTTTDDEVSAAQAFAAYLSADAQQTRLEQFGLRPALSEPLATSTVFGPALQYGIAAALPAVQPVQLPSSSSLLALNQLFR
ncbi:MAG: substrate-binding domain-containing protein [Chloroflexi bacterium]|nr:substrate-binding domain-containing protein [Chloroflexota bacterium]